MTDPPTMVHLGPQVDYFEVDSQEAGTRYAVAVVLPGDYGLSDQSQPVIYSPDGNIHAPLTALVSRGLMGNDPESICPVRSCVQVSIGYPAEQAQHQVALRNRDLLPPGEPYPPRMYPYLPNHLRVDDGLLPADVLDVFDQHIRDPHSDRFLAFIENELHPEIRKRYRVQDEDAGLFGFSYGGLFALCALSSGSGLFAKLGAGSPAILVEGSQAFSLYEDFASRATADEDRDVHVHISVTDFEMTGPTGLYRTLGIETLKFIDLMWERPVPGVRLSTQVILGHDHNTGTIPAYESFLRNCYPMGPSR